SGSIRIAGVEPLIERTLRIAVTGGDIFAPGKEVIPKRRQTRSGASPKTVGMAEVRIFRGQIVAHPLRRRLEQHRYLQRPDAILRSEVIDQGKESPLFAVECRR